MNAIPIDREATGRQSADLFKELIDDGRSLLIYPEGGRSPDGWAQPFKGGAAYLSAKTGVAVVPVHIEGTGASGKGMKRPRPGRTRVILGHRLRHSKTKTTRRYNARIESAVGRLTEESVSDYWTAARKASTGSADRLSGPETASWRRKWMLTDRRRREVSEGIADLNVTGPISAHAPNRPSLLSAVANRNRKGSTEQETCVGGICCVCSSKVFDRYRILIRNDRWVITGHDGVLDHRTP